MPCAPAARRRCSSSRLNAFSSTSACFFRSLFSSPGAKTSVSVVLRQFKITNSACQSGAPKRRAPVWRFRAEHQQVSKTHLSLSKSLRDSGLGRHNLWSEKGTTPAWHLVLAHHRHPRGSAAQKPKRRILTVRKDFRRAGDTRAVRYRVSAS